MKKTILLVSVHIQESLRAVPLGCAMVASSICKNIKDVKPKLLDLYLTDSFEDSLVRIEGEKPDYIGFSTFLWNRDIILKFAEALKKKHPCTIILGGPEASADKDRLGLNPNVDYIIEGEGENKILTILSPDNFSEKVVDLENLSSPYLDGTIDLEKRSGVLWELARGCPFKCDFCFESKGSKVVRNFPFERIRDELRAFKENGITEIFILDPTFNYNKKRAVKLLNLIIEEAPYIHYTIEIRAEYIDEELAYLFSQINCSLQIGLQSADPSVLGMINRNMNPEIFADNIYLLHENSVVYGFDLIYGLPTDTFEGFLSSLDYAVSLAPNHMDIFPLSILTGTKLHDNAKKLKLNFINEAPYSLIQSDSFSIEDMKKSDKIAEAFEYLYNGGKAVTWFILVTEALETSPSYVISEFSEYLEKKDKADDIFLFISGFIEDLFKKHGMENEGLTAGDMVRYFGYTSLLMEEENEYLTESDLHLNPNSYITRFSHDLTEMLRLFSGGITDITEISQILEPETNYVIFFVNDENAEVLDRKLDIDEYNFLKDFKNHNNQNYDITSPLLQKFIDEKIIWRRK